MPRIERMGGKPIEGARSRLQDMGGGPIEQMGQAVDMVKDLSGAGKPCPEAGYCDSATAIHHIRPASWLPRAVYDG